MCFRMPAIVIPFRSFDDSNAFCVISAAVGPFGAFGGAAAAAFAFATAIQIK